MLEKIRDILKGYTEVPAEKITPQSHFRDDLGLNSLDVVNVVVAFEDEFDIEIDDDDISSMVRVEDAIRYITERCQ